MAMRKIPLVTGEIYHVYNRGVDKRMVFSEPSDSLRFLESMIVFNSQEPIGSLVEVRLRKKGGPTAEPLVELIAYCLNPNHYHLLLRQITDGGISEFMKRLSGGYTWYFNRKHQRSGSLFQGKFKASHVNDNEYLLHVSVYVNRNAEVHDYSGPTAANIRSSWDEYTGKSHTNYCQKEEVLGQFRSPDEYREFANRVLPGIRERKLALKEWFHDS